MLFTFLVTFENNRFSFSSLSNMILLQRIKNIVNRYNNDNICLLFKKKVEIYCNNSFALLGTASRGNGLLLVGVPLSIADFLGVSGVWQESSRSSSDDGIWSFPPNFLLEGVPALKSVSGWFIIDALYRACSWYTYLKLFLFTSILIRIL